MAPRTGRGRLWTGARSAVGIEPAREKAIDPRGLHRVVVVGAGAAGLTASLRAAQAGVRVQLLNAHPKIGLKILMSGGTRCNVTHREVTARDFHGGSRAFVARILREFPPDAARAWLEDLGVSLKLEPTGKYFPETDDAHTVLDALLGAVSRAGVEVRSGARVVRLEPMEDAGEYGVRWRLGVCRVRDSAAFSAEAHAHRGERWEPPAVEPDEWLEARSVVLATGGLSFPRTGSDGVGYALAGALGHSIEPPVPALTPLASEDRLCERLQGLALEAELALWCEERRAETTRGSLLFTHFGYSGPAALDLSRHWHRAEGAQRRVTASFRPGETLESLQRAWLDAARDSGRSVRRHLGGSLPDRLVVEFCREAEIEPGQSLGQVERGRRGSLLRLLTARDLAVTGTLGFEKAEVTAGGVRLAEVDPKTLESREARGVYLCGEMLDVEGRLGGFNFQWAWSSGTVAGRGVGRNVVAES